MYIMKLNQPMATISMDQNSILRTIIASFAYRTPITIITINKAHLKHVHKLLTS